MTLSGLEKAALVLAIFGGLTAVVLIVAIDPPPASMPEGSFTVTRDNSGLIQRIA